MNQHVKDKDRVDADLTISTLYVETHALLALNMKYPGLLNETDKQELDLIAKQLAKLVERL